MGGSWVAMIILLKTGYPWWLALSVLVGVHGIFIYHAGKQKKEKERWQRGSKMKGWKRIFLGDMSEEEWEAL